jgi:hypothetical protein
MILILVFFNNAAGNKDDLARLNPTELTANWGIGGGI